MYQPATGRFITSDALQPNGPWTQGYQLYQYGSANPTTNVDPLGYGRLEAILAISACALLSPGAQVLEPTNTLLYNAQRCVQAYYGDARRKTQLAQDIALSDEVKAKQLRAGQEQSKVETFFG